MTAKQAPFFGLNDILNWPMPMRFAMAGVIAAAITAVLAGALEPGIGLILVLAVMLTIAIQHYLCCRAIAEVEAWIWRAGEEGGADLPCPQPDVFGDQIGRPVRSLARAAAAQRERVQSLELVVTSLANLIPDPILFVNGQQEIELSNDAAKRAFDITDESNLLGRFIRDPDFLSAISSAVRSGQGVQTPFVRPQMPEIRYSALIEPVTLPSGETGVLAAVREESEALLIERQRSDFIANVSHELRTPLTALMGAVETLLTTARDDRDARDMFLGVMADETRRMKRLVDDLLSLSRLENESSEPIDVDCDVIEVVERTVAAISPEARQSRIDVQVECSSEDIVCAGDPDQLQQVFRNLIENAMRYGGKDQTIWVRAAIEMKAPEAASALAGRPVAVISVIDQGPGIEPQYLSRLTERFYRVDKARSKAAGGTGLGLAIVKHILKRHAGHLAISSQIGEGSAFTVYLPYEPWHAAADTCH